MGATNKALAKRRAAEDALKIIADKEAAVAAAEATKQAEAAKQAEAIKQAKAAKRAESKRPAKT